MKKILSLILTFVILSALFLSTTAFADTALKVNGEQEVKPGDIVTYSVRIDDLKTKVMAINAHVVYNQEQLSLISGGSEQKAFEFGSALSSVMYNEALQNRFLFNCANGTGYFPFEEDNLIIRLHFVVNEQKSDNTDIPLAFEFLEIYDTDSVSLKEDTDYTLDTKVEVNVYEGSTEIVDKTKESVNAEPSLSGSTSGSNAQNNNTVREESDSSSGMAVIIICAVIVLFLIAIVVVLIIGKKKNNSGVE